VYPLVQLWSPGSVWVLLIGISTVLTLAPWAPPARKTTVAVVDLDNCNGCKRCADDCPFGAIEMVPRTDGTNYTHQPSVDEGLCISCGICVGACPTATPFRSRSALVPGIDLPNQTAADIRDDITRNAEAPSDAPRVMVFGCRDDRQTKILRSAGANVVTVRCMAHLQPSYLDFVLSRNHADGVMLLGCENGNCNYRFGPEWTEARVTRQRDPRLRKRTDTARIAMGWLAPWADIANPTKRLDAFRDALSKMDAKT